MASGTDSGIDSTEVALTDVLMVDEANGYVLCQYGPWTVWQPGFQQTLTTRPQKTLTTAEFEALNPRLFYDDQTPRGTYDAQRGTWVYPAADS